MTVEEVLAGVALGNALPPEIARAAGRLEVAGLAYDSRRVG